MKETFLCLQCETAEILKDCLSIFETDGTTWSSGCKPMELYTTMAKELPMYLCIHKHTRKLYYSTAAEIDGPWSEEINYIKLNTIEFLRDYWQQEKLE